PPLISPLFPSTPLFRSMLAELGLFDAELSVLLTDDSLIQQLNAEHRQKDRATDVLAFELDAPDQSEPRVLGDVVISLDTAARQRSEEHTSELQSRENLV